MTRYIKITIDMGGGELEEFALNYQDLGLMVSLIDRLKVSLGAWWQQEQTDREKRQRDRPRSNHSSNQQYYFYNNARGFDPRSFYGDFFSQGGANFFQGPPNASGAGLKSHKERLADLAGVEWETAESMDLKKLLRKAQHKCHPDTGGSHEQWLSLQKLKEEMKL